VPGKNQNKKQVELMLPKRCPPKKKGARQKKIFWDALKKENLDVISIQNTMRRIIEFYFKILANLDEEKIITNFEKETDKRICRSLISWLNVGSHDVFSDIDYTPTQEEAKNFREVFRKIFEYTNHLSHYNMMMGIKKDEKEIKIDDKNL